MEYDWRLTHDFDLSHVVIRQRDKSLHAIVDQPGIGRIQITSSLLYEEITGETDRMEYLHTEVKDANGENLVFFGIYPDEVTQIRHNPKIKLSPLDVFDLIEASVVKLSRLQQNQGEPPLMDVADFWHEEPESYDPKGKDYLTAVIDKLQFARQYLSTNLATDFSGLDDDDDDRAVGNIV